MEHLLLIIDGHRRYAAKKGLILKEAYLASACAIPNITNYVFSCNIDEFSIYAVSLYNLKRHPDELNPLNDVISLTLDYWLEHYVFQNVNIKFIGEISESNIYFQKIRLIENKYSEGRKLNILFNYSGDAERRRAIAECIRRKLFYRKII
jgi:undecaprenyl diphosphate synthase